MTSAGAVTVDVAGRDVNLVALLTRMETQMEHTNQVGIQLSQTTGGTFTAAQQRAANAAITEAQALARAAIAAGDDARAHSILVNALGQSAAASDRSVASLTTSINRLQGGANIAQQFGDAAKSSLLGIIGPAALAGAAIGALGQVDDLVRLGAQAEQTAARFDAAAAAAGRAGDAELAALRQASAGTISDLNLQLAANRARLLGVADSAEKLGPLLAVARDRAQEMGISTTQAFNDLVTGLGRGSALILDNLGITVSVTEANKAYAEQLGKNVSALTEAEQKQALINAVLLQSQSALTGAGGAIDSTAAKIERLNTSLDNLKAKAGGLLATGLGPSIDGLNRLTWSAQEQAQAVDSLAASQTTFVGRVAANIPVLGSVVSAGQGAAEAFQLFAGSSATAAVAQNQAAQAGQTNAQAQTNNAQATAQAAQATIVAAQATQVHTHLLSEHTAGGLAASVAAQQHAQALVEQITQTQQATQRTQELTQIQAALASLGPAVAGGLQTAGSAAAFLASRYNLAYGEALKLINAQAALASATPALPAALRATDREFDTPADRAEVKSNQALAANRALLARIASDEARANRASAGAGRAAGAAKLSDQQRLNNTLLNDQERYQNQAEQAERAHQQRLLDIDRDFQKRDAEQRRANEVAKRQGELGFLKSITASELNETARGRAEIQRINERFYADFDAAQKAAQAGNAAQSAAMVEQARERARVEQQYAEEIEAAREEGNRAEIARLEALREKERQILDEQSKQIGEGDPNVQARQAAIDEEQRRYGEAQEKSSIAAEQASERKVNAAQRSGQAVADETAQLREQEQILQRMGRTAAPGAPPAAPAGAGAAAAPPSGTPTPTLDLAGLAAALDGIATAVSEAKGAIVGAQRDTTSAVKGLSGRVVT